MTGLLLTLALTDPAALAAAVRNLSAPAFAERAAAEAWLLAVDPRLALPPVFAATADPDPERGRRAAALYQTLLRRDRTRLALAGPGCELALTNAPLLDAAKAILTQTGVRVGFDPPDLALTRVTVRTPGRVPVWAAVHALAAAAGLEADAPRYCVPTVPHEHWPTPVPAGPVTGTPAVAPDHPEVGPLASMFADWCRAGGSKNAGQVRSATMHLDGRRWPWRSGAVEVLLKPATGPVAACAVGGFQVQTVPLPAELAASVPRGRGAVLLRLSLWSLGGWQAGFPELRLVAGGRPLPRPPVQPRPMVEPAGEVALVVGFDGRPRRLPTAGTAPFRTGLSDILVRVPEAKPLTELRGVFTSDLYGTVELRLDGNKVRAISPLPATVTATADGHAIRVEARYPLGVWPWHDWPPRVRGEPVGPVSLVAARHGAMQVVGRPGAVGTLTAAAGRKAAGQLFGVTVRSDRGATLPLTLKEVRLAVGADGWVSQTLTATAAATGKPASLTFGAVVPADIPFHLRDVPVLAGTGEPE